MLKRICYLMAGYMVALAGLLLLTGVSGLPEDLGVVALDGLLAATLVSLAARFFMEAESPHLLGRLLFLNGVALLAILGLYWALGRDVSGPGAELLIVVMIVSFVLGWVAVRAVPPQEGSMVGSISDDVME